MTTYRQIRAFVLVAASALALVAATASLGAAPAAAKHKDSTTYKGATAKLIHKKDQTFTLAACDRLTDGYGAVAILHLPSGLGSASTRDLNGANNGCGKGDKVELSSKLKKVYLWACIKDHNGKQGGRKKCQPRPTVINP